MLYHLLIVSLIGFINDTVLFQANDLIGPDAEQVLTNTRQNSYSISHLLGTVTTQWLDSDSVVTIVNCQQHSDNTVDQL